MKVLFLHHNFPAQFYYLAQSFAMSSENEVVFISQYKRDNIDLTGVHHIQLKAYSALKIKNEAERVLLDIFHTGEIFANGMLKLKQDGFIPDVVYDHSGWGCGMYVPDIFPQAARVCYCEWFYTKEADFSFFSNGKPRPSIAFAANRQRNLCQLDALRECDIAISPTRWQMSRYPIEYAHKIRILHDGIDIDFFSPLNSDETESPMIGRLDLSNFSEIVTYATRGLEPYRGFPQFYKSIPAILEARPHCHVIIMANDKVFYGAPRSDGKTWKKAMQDEIQVDSERVHFLPFGSYTDYRRLLRYSSVHVYLTVPFVLSWSLLEAMSCGCAVVASNTEPIQEMIQNRKNGILTSFWNHQMIAGAVIEVLTTPCKYIKIRQAARKTICDRYALRSMLPQHIQLIMEAVSRKKSITETVSFEENVDR